MSGRFSARISFTWLCCFGLFMSVSISAHNAVLDYEDSENEFAVSVIEYERNDNGRPNPAFIGDDNRPEAAVINGQTIAPNSFPFVVSLQKHGSHFCGGSIISRTHILTAAHCVDGESARAIKVGVGLNNKNTASPQNFYPVARINVHQNWDSSRTVNDIALLTLARPISDKHGSNIRPIALPRSRNATPKPGSKVIAVGWGQTHNTRKTSPARLQGAVFTILSQQDCARRSGRRTGDWNVPDTKICIDNSRSSVCYGDSGGPLFRKLNSGKFHLDGIVSHGIGPCQEGQSANMFTRVSQFITWIAQAMQR